MASTSTTLSLCTSLTTQCQITHHHHNPNPLSKTLFLFKPISGFSLQHHKRISSPSISTRQPTFLSRPKFSVSEASAVIDVEPEQEAEPSQVVEIAQEEEPKREDVFAVVMIGGRQYIVIPGRFLYVQRIKGVDVNDKVILNKVLLVGTRTSTYIGKPVVTNAAVHAVVEDHGRDAKVIVFKYKKKKNYRRNIGHRQPNTRIRITGITGYQDFPAVTLESLNSSRKLEEAAHVNIS